MAIYLASKTAQAIDDAIKADQGATFRQHLKNVLPHIGDAYRGVDAPFRNHMGASSIGKECAREIWYSFRWAKAPEFEGRILRLFNRGHLEEARFIAMLLTIGCAVYQQDAEGNQFRISGAGGHFGGSGDGIGYGIPDLDPNTPCLLEFKTHNDKSFRDLVANGVRESKFEHFVQIQVYMRKMGLAVALYGAVNKNDDSLYWELVPLDPEFADQFVDRGEQLPFIETAPARISESPGWYKCKWCDFRKICHQGAMPDQNCRTCTFSKVETNGTWSCTHPRMDTGEPGNKLTTEDQLNAARDCGLYKAHNSFGKRYASDTTLLSNRGR